MSMAQQVTINPGWLQPPPDSLLESGEVNVWLADLNAARITQFQPVLSPDEQERAKRFQFEKDRAQYVIARGILRSILARYLQTAPEKLGFRYNQYGKPSLADDPATHKV